VSGGTGRTPTWYEDAPRRTGAASVNRGGMVTYGRNSTDKLRSQLCVCPWAAAVPPASRRGQQVRMKYWAFAPQSGDMSRCGSR
jgi:hypothetical protein